MERFVPGRHDDTAGPLASYLQPQPEQVVVTYLRELSHAGGLVVSPFAQSDTLIRLAQATGRRSISAHINPLLPLLARSAAAPMPKAEAEVLPARVGDALRHSVTLRQHILDLYRSRCPACRWDLSADYFVWEREPHRPVLKGFRCPSCGETGEVPVDEDDLRIAREYEGRGLAYWRVASRLAERSDPIFSRVQALLDLYTGRNLHALLELTRRIEALACSGPARDACLTILLECLDRGSSLDPVDRGHRLARLGVPARFVERNVWQVFLAACEEAAARADRPTVAFDTQLREPLAGDAIVVSSVSQLTRQLPPGSVELAIGAPPPPSPAFWTASYMWAAWLLGREEAAPLSHWLRRYSTDWNWYSEVIQAVFTSLARVLAPEGRIVLAFQSEQERWIESIIAGAGLAGLSLAGLACQPLPNGAEYRLVLATHQRAYPRPSRASGRQALEKEVALAGLEGVLDVLKARGEPTPGPTVHAAAYRALLQRGLLEPSPDLQDRPSMLQFLSDHIWGDATTRGKLELCQRPANQGGPHDGTIPGLQPDLWWTSRADGKESPLLDRVERFVLQLLAGRSIASLSEILDAVYEEFTGLVTPTEEDILTCLASYGRPVSEALWELRPEDDPACRKEEMRKLRQRLKLLGERLGASVSTTRGAERGKELGLRPTDVLWQKPDEAPHLFRIVSDTIAEHLQHAPALAALVPRSYLVVPDSRASLIAYRRQAHPLWNKAMEQNAWQVIKYSHMRRLLTEESVSINSLVTIVGLDPIVEQDEAQIPLF